MNADTDIKKLLSENEYEESYYNKYNEELIQLEDSIITCNDRKEALESDLEVRETRKRQKKVEKEESERKVYKEKEERERKVRKENEKEEEKRKSELQLKVVESKYRIEDIESLMNELRDIISTKWNVLDDVQLLAMKKKVQGTTSTYNDLRERLEKLSEFVPLSYLDRVEEI